MKKINTQEILPFVEMPSRYLGCEVNSIKKDLTKVDLKFALAFPDLYEIGTSHFGMQILYTILNQQENIAAERFFTPAPDMEKILLEKKISLFSLESEVELKSFDIVGFSLLYELNFTNILTMLNLSGIPFYSKDRDASFDGFPLIIAGGPCTFNPEPLSDFFDTFVIGDGEEVVLQIAQMFIEWKKEGNSNKISLLKRLSKIQGVYIPSFFKVTYKSMAISEIERIEPLEHRYERVKRAILPDISSVAFPTSPVVPFGRPVHDRLRLEIARGCSRGCRFCQAGMIYRPVRERSLEQLVDIAKTALKQTGYSDLSLLSLSTGDYSNLAPLMEQLMSINTGHCISISLPSVRAGKLTSPLMKIIKRVKKTGFTIAPEAGSQRLRDVINKNITEDDIFNTVNSAFELGWRNIKLYFMNGLPTETHEDIEAIADMAKKLAKIKTTGKGKSSVSISFATFIPKPHTPFERCSQIHPDKAMDNLNFLKEHLRHPGINIKWQHPKMSLLEGVWARGDRRLAKVLVKAWEKGCRLDGWSDMFRFDLWQQAFDECGIDPFFYTLRQREKDEVLPWSHIDCAISKEFMDNEYNRAMVRELTHDCREYGCIGCGICDFKTIQPVLFDALDATSSVRESEKYHKYDSVEESEDLKGNQKLTQQNQEIEDSQLKQTKIHQNKIQQNKISARSTTEAFIKLTIFYSRLGKAKHFGHLELAKIIRRAIRRAGIRVKYSTGFSPAMKISFDNPLPVGMESEEEFFSIYLDKNSNFIQKSIKPDDIVAKLNAVLPQSITITRCVCAEDLTRQTDKNQKAKGKNLEQAKVSTSYRINLKTFFVEQQAVDNFMALPEFIVEKLNFKGTQRATDLRKITERIALCGSCEELNCASNILEMTLSNDQQRTIRPVEILTEVFQIPENVLRAADILKLKHAQNF